MSPERLVIASRESRLAMWQAEHVQARLRALYPDCDVSILGLTTEGDRIQDRPLNEIGGKGLFIKELEHALADGRADLAVHSLKDVPMDMPPGFELAAVMQREDPRDAFVSNRFDSLEGMPAGSRIGTSSLRRAAQIRHRLSHCEILPLRGNVNTRLARLDEGRFDAIVLAAAGLKRLGLADRIRGVIAPSFLVPAAGQGALAIETRDDRSDLRQWLAPLRHEPTLVEVTAERACARELAGNCRVPLAAWCVTRPQGGLELIARVGAPDGSELIEAVERSEDWSLEVAETLGLRAAARLLDQGAGRWLASS